jgi:hypothetical protein
MSEVKAQRMRVYHRYLGYFLAGIMAVYSISGMIMIFRDTDFLKREKLVEKQLNPNMKGEEVGKEIRIRDLKIEREEDDVMFFKQGTYNKGTGAVKYTTKELPYFVEKLTKLHKANTKSPVFFMNVFFGLSLLFFVVSSFWMFLPNTKVFRKGLYFVLAGVVLTLILIFI